MLKQRNVIGLLGIICIASGCGMLFLSDGENNSISGILIRVGLMLGATWLAFPSFQLARGRHSFVVLAAFVGLLILAAARRNVFFIVGGLIVVGLFVQWVSQKLKQS